MTIPAGDTTTSVALTELSERQRERALERYRKLRPHLEQDAPLADVAKEASLPLRTAQRWVSRYRQFGLIGLIRAGRTDQGKRRRVPDDLRRLAEGLALERPPLGPSAIYREICRILMKEPHLGQVARVIAQYHALADIGQPRSESIAEEVEPDVRIHPFALSILAVDDLRLGGMQLQAAPELEARP